MATRIEIEPGWYDQLGPEVNDLVIRVARAIRVDAQTICPVDTGDLKASLVDTNPRPGIGWISSDIPYCLAVEFGFHGEEYVRPHLRLGRPVRGHVRRGNSPEQPFLRPSLYRTRDLSSL